MSAYALSFTSYLPPVIKSTTPQSQCSSNNRIDNESMLSYNQPLSAVHVEIKSAMIDAGALVRPSRRSKSNNSTANNYFSLPDDAVVFKLSINFNGRKYNASRSFDKFVKFRRDLVKELKHGHGRQVNHAFSLYEQSASALPILPECISDQPNIHLGLPNMSSINSMALAAASNGTSGFTKLQSLLLCHYCPLMQCWLKQIINTMDVDASTSLNNFLWEPLRNDDDDNSVPSVTSGFSTSSCSTSSHKGSIGSVMSLSSIHEDYDNDFDSDCDE